jgi:hypothetical protein
MTFKNSDSLTTNKAVTQAVKEYIDGITDDLMSSFPPPQQVSPEGRREIIGRYTAVLEGNFIYWMAGTYLSAKSEEARSIIHENLSEEIRDCHPGMLRRFAIAANAVPTDSDAMAINPRLSEVRHFIGRLSPAPILTMMAFFEGFIQRFMPYLAELAKRQGSEEMEYTDVHSGCDIGHSLELYRALEEEMRIAADPRDPAEYLFEGIELLGSLMLSVIPAPAYSVAA